MADAKEIHIEVLAEPPADDNTMDDTDSAKDTEIEDKKDSKGIVKLAYR